MPLSPTWKELRLLQLRLPSEQLVLVLPVRAVGGVKSKKKEKRKTLSYAGRNQEASESNLLNEEGGRVKQPKKQGSSTRPPPES